MARTKPWRSTVTVTICPRIGGTMSGANFKKLSHSV
jgi:hypothetical protein